MYLISVGYHETASAIVLARESSTTAPHDPIEKGGKFEFING